MIWELITYTEFIGISFFKVIPFLRRLAGISPCRIGLDLRPIERGFVVQKVTLQEMLLRFFMSFCCQYHSPSPTYTFSSSCYCYWKVRRAKSGYNL